MKKKYIIIGIIVVVIVGGILFATSYYKQKQEDEKASTAEVFEVLPPVYGVIEWEILCQDNQIEYDEEAVKSVKEDYKTLMDLVELSDTTTFQELIYILGIDSYLEIDDTETHEWAELYYSDGYKLYMNYLPEVMAYEDQYATSIIVDINAATRFKRADVAIGRDIGEGLLKYYQDNLDNIDDEEVRGNLMSIIYYLWDENECADIDMDPLIPYFQDIYDSYCDDMQDEAFEYTTAYLGYDDFIEICNAMGIDTSLLETLTEEEDFLDEDNEENWVDYGTDELACSYMTASIYFDELRNGNSMYSDNDRFTEIFGENLGTYCRETLLPIMEELIEEYSK